MSEDIGDKFYIFTDVTVIKKKWRTRGGVKLLSKHPGRSISDTICHHPLGENRLCTDTLRIAPVPLTFILYV